jgi:hypothetical protein
MFGMCVPYYPGEPASFFYWEMEAAKEGGQGPSGANSAFSGAHSFIVNCF